MPRAASGSANSTRAAPRMAMSQEQMEPYARRYLASRYRIRYCADASARLTISVQIPTRPMVTRMKRMTAPKPTMSKRHLPRRLRKLIGRWNVEGQFVGGEEILDVRGSVTCSWLVKDALAVWRERSTVAPTTISVMGADDNQNAFTILHSDERGVVRRLEMTLTAHR